MGTWGVPNTTEKAILLEEMMGRPVFASEVVERLHDVLGGHERLPDAQAVFLDHALELRQRPAQRLAVRLDPDALPALREEVGGVVLQPVTHTDLHEAPVADADAPESPRPKTSPEKVIEPSWVSIEKALVAAAWTFEV